MTQAVLLLSHGSRDPRAERVAGQLVAALARRLRVEVRASYLDFTDPTPEAALRDLAGAGFDDVRLVPLLFTPGYHVSHDVPGAVDASGVRGVRVAPPLITVTPRSRFQLLRALTDRLAEAGAADFDGLVLAAAGSSSPAAREAVEGLSRALGELHGVPCRPAFASATGPRVAESVSDLRGQGIRRPAVASLFVAPGRLADACAASAAEVPVAAPLGTTPAFVELLAEHARVAGSTSSRRLTRSPAP